MLAVVLAVWFALQLVVASLQTALPLAVLLASQLLTMTVVLAGCRLLLTFKALQSRWWQAALSLVGVDIMLTLASLPLLLINLGASERLPLIDGIYLLLVSWQLAAHGFIYHRSLNVSPFLGLGIALMLLIVSYAAVVMLLPQVLRGGA
ncbi:hypothetical protein A11A3_03102 [Alcanivorax hongdengensis A-11-3]|uniref:Uncharacterized protein n=1 Tax=Alcanivorax hongdengensis A-11-3 TaxID=1177179 RepID=L0WG52_9GAMM|nr:hypothetical protein A11A3_03102 [Alcanivorax hongdengensis A-11-3]